MNGALGVRGQLSMAVRRAHPSHWQRFADRISAFLLRIII